MSTSILSSSLFAITATGAGARAVSVIALALVVRVDNKPTPLYAEPDRDQKWKTLASLSGGAIILGALVACILGFLFTIAFEFVGGLLRA